MSFKHEKENDKKTNINKYIIAILADHVLFGAITSVVSIPLTFWAANFFNNSSDNILTLSFLFICLAYIVLFKIKAKRKTLTDFHTYFFFTQTIAYALTAALLVFITKGLLESKPFQCILLVTFPYFILYGLFALADIKLFVFGMFAVYLTTAITCAVLTKKRGIIPLTACCLMSAAFCGHVIKNTPNYSGHGFDYMHGYSSTDFKGYNVYDGEKLAVLDHESKFCIENEEDMPILDGAEACYPLYCAIAKAVYKNIDKTEAEFQAEIQNNTPEYRTNGKIVTFTNTVVGYERLINKDVDLMFGARPSQNQKEAAANNGEQIVSIPIGKEAFVFFVEDDNPVDDLSWEDVKNIYSGKITNWKEVGGKSQNIVAFQRPAESGSQVTMLYFMGNTPLKQPKTYETVDAMEGVISHVAQYTNEAGAIGYTFRYFLEELHQEKHVKMLSIGGVYPTLENIENGSYPLTVNLVCAKLKSNNDPYVQEMIAFLRSDDGKQIIKKTGYAPLDGNDITEIEETFQK